MKTLPTKRRNLVIEVPSPVPDTKAYFFGACRVIVGQEPNGPPDMMFPDGTLRWHLSISHPHRYPTWDEIHDARYRFIPNEATMAMLLPPQEEYVNIHENCFHLHEIDPEPLIIKP